MHRPRRTARILLALLTTIPVAGGTWALARLRSSLPALDGRVQVAGLGAAVTVTRDTLGVPTVRGRSREDVARATGFLHAQDRFFQMDLARRRAAGELAGLVGRRALPADREIRLHRFRAEAERALTLMSPRDRGVLDAYTAGVNAGLGALRATPFEYALLRQAPQTWRPEDSLLVVLSMFITLQDRKGAYESTLGTLYDVLPPGAADFFAPHGTDWDSPVVGTALAMPPVPGPGVYNPRATRAGKPHRRRERVPEVAHHAPDPVSEWLLDTRGEPAVGSNAFAVSGRLTNGGGALVANDMHLDVRVPNTWYRAALEWPDPADPSTPNTVSGVTLPGVPAIVVGSNTHIAWGFTNTYGDWTDLILLDIDPQNPGRYRTPQGWREFDRHDETIPVAGEADEHVTVEWTIWGPVLDHDHRGRARALRWVAHAAERLASTVTPMEAARSVDEAIEAANGLGTPGQNIVIADRSGRIGWTVFGSIPRREGLDGTRPLSWADGSRGWNGWLAAADYPRLVDPEGGRIWTANQRVVDGDMLGRLGDGGYEVGSRARQIRDRLQARDRFAPADLLAIQLDARAGFLSRWRDLMLRVLTPQALAGRDDRRELREALERTWTGAADPQAAAYRLTRAFREQVMADTIGFVLADCYEADPDFDYTTVRRREGPVWALVTEQPMHLLDPAYKSWNDLMLASLDAVVRQTLADGVGTLAEATWDGYNASTYRHPLSAAVPLLGRWLDMPARPLPGDLFTPRMRWGTLTSSERMVVSPGREREGIMHMPTGQSGHPLSPFYANSHAAWADGEATPFLPGPTAHTLTLTP